ncbi:MAG: GntR family transcriptional regulator [Chloroflexota bacterium]
MGHHPFQRLQSDLATLIDSLPADSQLPSEPTLALKMGVSRATLREAMRSFETQGKIRRKQGVGTFVIGDVPLIESGLEILESIETLAGRIGLSVSTHSLKVEKITADLECALVLDIPIGSGLTRISRLIMTDGRPAAYLVDTLSENILSQADLAAGFTGSVLDLLLRRGSPRLVSSRTEINAVNATAEVAHLLEIQRGDVLINFTACLYSSEGQVIDHSLSYFLPGYFKFHVNRRVG